MRSKAIDKALVEFGFPVGPLTLIDEVGLDIAGKSSAVMIGAFGYRMIPAVSIAKVIEAGRTGRKGGKGFYRYEQGKKKGVDETVYPLFSSTGQRMLIGARDIVERCVFAMLNEAARCLEEGIVSSARDGDVGAVFGIGFPPFRGGPCPLPGHAGHSHRDSGTRGAGRALLASIRPRPAFAGDGRFRCALLSGSGKAPLGGKAPVEGELTGR